MPNIVNNQGEQFLSPQHPTQRELKCDYEAFKQQRINFETSLDHLANFNGSTVGTTVAAMLEVQ